MKKVTFARRRISRCSGPVFGSLGDAPWSASPTRSRTRPPCLRPLAKRVGCSCPLAQRVGCLCPLAKRVGCALRTPRLGGIWLGGWAMLVLARWCQPRGFGSGASRTRRDWSLPATVRWSVGPWSGPRSSQDPCDASRDAVGRSPWCPAVRGTVGRGPEQQASAASRAAPTGAPSSEFAWGPAGGWARSHSATASPSVSAFGTPGTARSVRRQSRWARCVGSRWRAVPRQRRPRRSSTGSHTRARACRQLRRRIS